MTKSIEVDTWKICSSSFGPSFILKIYFSLISCFLFFALLSLFHFLSLSHTHKHTHTFTLSQLSVFLHCLKHLISLLSHNLSLDIISCIKHTYTLCLTRSLSFLQSTFFQFLWTCDLPGPHLDEHDVFDLSCHFSVQCMLQSFDSVSGLGR